MTSDEFFESNVEYFELILLDGLNEAHQVYRDIHHALRWLSPKGTIVIYDVNPRGDYRMSSNPRVPEAMYWTGDRWKAVVALRLMPDVEVVVVDVDFGVAVLRRRPNLHPLAEAEKRYLGTSPISMLRFNHISRHRGLLHRLVSLDELVEWLDEEREDPIHREYDSTLYHVDGT